MAPFVGPRRDEVLRLLRSKLARGRSITVGQYAPEAVIRREGDRWTFRALELDQAAAAEAARDALANGGTWMPEMEFAFLRPGRELASGATAAELADSIEAMPWPFEYDR